MTSRPTLRSIAYLATGTVLLVAAPLSAQLPEIPPTPPTTSAGNPFLQALGFIAVLLAVWGFCYMGLYPWLRKHYDETTSRAIFWPMLFLWLITGFHLSCYLIIDAGFYHGWIPITAIFFTVVFSLWFFVAFARRSPV